MNFYYIDKKRYFFFSYLFFQKLQTSFFSIRKKKKSENENVRKKNILNTYNCHDSTIYLIQKNSSKHNIPAMNNKIKTK